MINKKAVMFGILFLFGISLVVMFSSEVSAVGEATVCCEKTTEGAWCQDASDVSDCSTAGSLRSAPTSCEATSYCRLGTCVNTLEGLCMSNVPAKVCEDPKAAGTEVAAGIWHDSEPEELNQCQLGCCLIGDQASFTTQTRCKQLSSVYGLETNYRSDIATENECITSATPKVKGACVFEEEFQNTCRFLTKSECQDLENSGIENVEFNAGLLCSAEQLETNCGPSKKTSILEGRDEVWFIDTCGNPANIYDANLQNEPSYWEEIVPKAFSCGFGNPNARSATCGNCDYFLGSTGKLYDRAKDGGPSPNFGNYICRDLSCGTVDGEDRQHGETWCVNSAKSENLADAPGSRYFREVCYNGEVTIEPCADYRQEICIEDSIGDFSTAACRVNKWQDCVAQNNAKDCNNIDRRDCTWRSSKCLPTHPPGFDFWSSETEAAQLCLQASTSCEVKFEKGFSGAIGELGDAVGGADEEWRCVSGCECVGLGTKGKLDDINLDNNWVSGKNNICLALGDCGVSVNSQNDEGYYNLKNLVHLIDSASVLIFEIEEYGGGLFG